MINIVFEAIEQHKLALIDHPFCQHLRSYSGPHPPPLVLFRIWPFSFWGLRTC